MQTSIAAVKEIGSGSTGGVKIIVSTDNGDLWLFPDKGVSINGMSAGQLIQFEWYKPAGKSYAKLKSWKPSEASATISPPPAYVKPTQSTGLSVTEPALRFISNIVGLAVQAKTIQNPGDIKTWTLAANEALKSLENPTN